MSADKPELTEAEMLERNQELCGANCDGADDEDHVDWCDWMREAHADLIREREARQKAEQELEQIVGAIQRHLQPPGSPPPGGSLMLVRWCIDEIKDELATQSESVRALGASFDREREARQKAEQELEQARTSAAKALDSIEGR